MAHQWFFAWDDKKFGPFSAAQLQELATLGRLQPTDLVWHEGVAKGVPAATIQHLFSSLPAKLLPIKAKVLGVAEPFPAPPPRGPGFSTPRPAVTLVPWLNVDRLVMPDDQRGIIPDGLKLRPMAGEDDSVRR